MKQNKIDLEYLKRMLLVVLTMSVIFILLDLYVPFKRFLFGDRVLFSEILSSIKYRHHFPYILIAGIVIGYIWTRSNNQNANK